MPSTGRRKTFAASPENKRKSPAGYGWQTRKGGKWDGKRKYRETQGSEANMLVDTRKLHTVKDARQGLDYTPGDYAKDNNVFVYRMIWEGESEGDIKSYADLLDFIVTFEVEGEECMTTAEACDLLDSERSFRLGPDDDWYRITPLPEPMTHDRYGKLVAIDDLAAA